MTNETNQEREFEKDIKVPVSRYVELLKAELKLQMLESGGVDSWDWYGDSLYPEDKEGKDYNYYCKEIDEEHKQ